MIDKRIPLEIPFLRKPGEPPYWFRNDPVEVERHRRMIAVFEDIMKLKPSRSATPSIDYPGPRVYGHLSPDDRDTELDFECEVCRRTFSVPLDEYRGQWDHAPNVPVCPECAGD